MLTTDGEFHKSIREAVLAILDACERHWDPNDPRNEFVMAFLDEVETLWFPSDVRTAEMRRQWKEAKRQGLIR